MDTNMLYDTLNRYFKRLSQVGYVKSSDVLSILVLSYLLELKKESDYFSEEQKIIINKAILCLQGNCFIPYSSCKGICIQ